MPELPDLTVYLHALDARVRGQTLYDLRIASPFVLRSVHPPVDVVCGHTVTAVRRLGKRIVLALEPEYYVVLHLMIAGRLRWRPPGSRLPIRGGLAAFDFAEGSLLFTEAGRKHRASIHLVEGDAALREHDRGGVEVLDAPLDLFRAVLRRENHTLKRALTDPRLFSGIGNAYSDEILHAARLSPFKLTAQLDDYEVERLYDATRHTLQDWIDRLLAETGDGFPDTVTAFRPEMAVHGRYGAPCPACGSPVQRIRYAEHEANYCATCQTGGRLLRDRSLSRLLKQDWPRSLEELESRLGGK